MLVKYLAPVILRGADGQLYFDMWVAFSFRRALYHENSLHLVRPIPTDVCTSFAINSHLSKPPNELQSEL
jgi:hypothetical protein